MGHLFRRLSTKREPSSYSVVKLSRCECTVTKKVLIQTSWQGKWSLFVWVSLIISPANGCSLVNKFWIVCVCWTLCVFFFRFCLPSRTSSSCHPKVFWLPAATNCPLDSQIVWQHLAVTSGLRIVLVDCGNAESPSSAIRSSQEGERGGR